MKLKTFYAAGTFIALLFLTGCSMEPQEYNKPAAYWYKKMIASISKGDLERADQHYSSLQSEHIGSPLLVEATLMIAEAHIDKEEYLLSEHFLNEFINRYADSSQREYAEYLKVKAKYLGLPNVRRDQGLITEAIKEGEGFKARYPQSRYRGYVDTMIVRLYLARAQLHQNIAGLYERLDKPKAAAYYANLEVEPWVKWDEVENADTGWYREIFEGDGTASWYGFLIPDTQSVVSRNSNDEE